MKKTLLLLFTAFSFIFSGYAQDVNVAELCGDNVDVMRIEFNFDKALEQRSSLTMLDISMQHPKLTDLPKELVQFRQLTYLNLGFNRLVTLSPSILQLRNLECLDLSGNYNLQTLPVFLNQLPRLKVIRLQDMPYWSDKKKEEIKSKFPKIQIIY